MTYQATYPTYQATYPTYQATCSIRGGGGEPFLLLSNVLDTKGEGGEGVSPSHGADGDFLEV